MADTVMTLTQIENFFQTWTSEALGTTVPSAVRISWHQDGAPSWHITDDVCFLMVRTDDNPYTRNIQTDYSPLDTYNANANQVSTDGIAVSWNLYGPNSFENARLIRATLFTDPSTQTFSASNLALITDVAMPTRVPEHFNGQWWNRSTLYATFNLLTIRQTTVPYIQTANVNTQEG